MKAEAIKTLNYLSVNEIKEHLENVEYIIMAAPSPEYFKDTPIHFTIFLNTCEELPKEIQEAVFEKFLDENSIKNPIEVMSQIMPVGFSQSQQETLMPLLLVKQEDMRDIPNFAMFVFDFLADSDNFSEAKDKSLTGWSYSYSN
ncbi:MAG: hypothetical protein A2513_09100 [Sulfurimonas sp. RIFOXYD12_FULL_33_39]|uniref:hypothetical protein n=1 Tax=unclassified Sulfurimonas TaxID=2623549 RepID=UPI0008AEB26E|nr:MULTISPECIES: hypothetical protein [unclassified Sulfurimonas]OHE10236.1 MAG: hypothetical protein A2513_09100 [Sulfurimonas sp. RIFOXYD12_FULL_33_39]OHE14543.1 MAG: hypothetical protein A2530_01380 [Sulfurimonas sp. RIFOXYD2_FULL_34_21]